MQVCGSAEVDTASGLGGQPGELCEGPRGPDAEGNVSSQAPQTRFTIPHSTLPVFIDPSDLIGNQ